MTMNNTIKRLESEVRSYSRLWPVTFTRAKGHTLWDADGNPYLDFFTGAGSLNYGHNHDHMKEALLGYLAADGITHSLDMATEPRAAFLAKFEEVVLKPRGMDYVVQFPGPTGTNAVEAALKLARKYTGRDLVIGFTNAFHGMTLGSLSVTGNETKRGGAGVSLGNAVSMPYDGFLGDEVDTIAYLDAFIQGESSGIGLPAAVIVETVQGEGGINVAGKEWLQKLQALCRNHEILLIVDDIQMGCGRTGSFFSFDGYGIEPDIVTLSKSLSGYGLPLSITIFRRDLDVWEPGEHNGTFRGNNPAFVTATRALDYWANDELAKAVRSKAAVVEARLDRLAQRHEAIGVQRRGRGLAQGVAFDDHAIAEEVARGAFAAGLVMETSGANGEVAKLFPPLTIPDEALAHGLSIFEQTVDGIVQRRRHESAATAVVAG